MNFCDLPELGFREARGSDNVDGLVELTRESDGMSQKGR